jgi:hexosaminidase
MKTKLIALILSLGILFTKSNNLKIIPEPQIVESTTGFLKIENQVVKIQLNSFNLTKKKLNNYQLKPTKKKPLITVIKDSRLSKEAYNLEVNQKGIQITTSSNSGLYYALVTLEQVIENNKISYLSIKDAPRYPFRALMLDPARHFLPIEDIKKYVEVMSQYKFNKLHLHLTDDQGWRIEINGYEKLTSIGSIREETDGDGLKHEGYYTQKELKELVAFAKDRFVEIIPELDMPGHSDAILAGYPEYTCFEGHYKVRTIPGVSENLMCAGNPKIYEFYNDIIAQIANIFPYPEIHIGGDEAPTIHWEKCKKCQKLIKEKNLKDEKELMNHFFEEVKTILAKYNKKPLLWFEEGHSYPENSSVYLWRLGTAQRVIKETKKQNLKLICAPGEFAYFDYPQNKSDKKTAPGWMPNLHLQQVYKFDPSYGLNHEEQKHIIGVEACIWGESVKDIDRAFYMTFPRALAMSEAGWSQQKNKSFKKFKSKLTKHLDKLMKNGVNYCVPYYIDWKK